MENAILLQADKSIGMKTGFYSCSDMARSCTSPMRKCAALPFQPYVF
jgi:hypothetical protein